MKIIFAFFTLLMTFCMNVNAQVDIYSTFKDGKFNWWIRANVDKNHDLQLSDEEIAAVTSMNISYQDISDLTGINYFTSLERLYCDNNNLTTLTLDIPTLKLVNCQYNQLKTLNVTKLTALTSLYCSSNELKSLDVSNNTNLNDLQCPFNNITSLNVSNNTHLTSLRCFHNNLKTVNVSMLNDLAYFYCGDNPLTSFDISHNLKLIELSCYNNNLTALDVSKHTKITRLFCHGNKLTSLNLSNLTNLERLNCSDNLLESLNVSMAPKLEEFSCKGNKLTSLDVSKNTALRSFDCSNNLITSLNVANCTNIYMLTCNENRMFTLDLSNNSEITFENRAVISPQNITAYVEKLDDGRLAVDLMNTGYDSSRFKEYKADGVSKNIDIEGRYLIVANNLATCPETVSYRYDTNFINHMGNHVLMNVNITLAIPEALLIDDVENDPQNNAVRYNLNGQMVGNDYKGIVIINRKKFLIK